MVRGVGLAWVTVPAGIVAATLPPHHDLAMNREGQDPLSPALAVSLGGDIDRWGISDLVASPPNQLDLSMLLLGQPGVGKSTAERITHLAVQENRQVVAIDGKGDEDFAAGIIALNLTARPDARIGLFPATLRPLALVAGRAGRPRHGCLALHSRGRVLRQHRPARPPAGDLGPRPSADPVGRQLVKRLDPAWFSRSWDGRPAELGIFRDLKGRLAEVVVRMGNLAAALGGAFDGCWAVEDVDLAVFTVSTLANASDGDACMRMLLGDLSHYAVRRKPRQRRALVLFDKFSSLERDRRTAVNLIDRARGPHVGVVLCAQSAVSLGDEDARQRLLASANAILPYPDAAPLTALAGSLREPRPRSWSRTAR